jgi:enoyl-CoA hydratase
VPDELVHLHVADSVATITLDSPANRNALSAALVGQLRAQLATAREDETVRAVVLTHTGSTFCAGADLSEMTSGASTQEGTARMLELLRMIVELPKPVIAQLTGNARAGGVGIVGACDVALALPSATFAFSEARLGLAPAVISLTTLGRMDERSAARYYLTGDVFDGIEAARSGLLTQAPDDLAAALSQILDSLRACSPQGLAQTKALITAPLRTAIAERGAEMAQLSGRLFASEEAREGMTAFLQRRPPRWAKRPGQ